MHECILYEKMKNKTVKCKACRHYCIIPEGSTGICGVRYNENGKLYLLVYGKAAAFNVDPIEKKPLFHFLPGTQITSIGTIGCNFKCEFCQNWEISQVTRNIKEKEKQKKEQITAIKKAIDYGRNLSPEELVDFTVKNKIPSIAYTYNEPAIFFEYAYDTIILGKKKKINSVFVTNGYDSKEAIDKLGKNLDAINSDLKGFTEEFYQRVCGGKLENVLEGIKYVHKKGVWQEITTLVIPGKNDSKEELREIAEFVASIDKNMPWHVTAFHPEYKMLDVPATSQEKLLEAFEIGKKAGLNFVYVGNIFTKDKENTYCPNCNELLIERVYFEVEIKEIDLRKGKCKNCGVKIPGIWS